MGNMAAMYTDLRSQYHLHHVAQPSQHNTAAVPKCAAAESCCPWPLGLTPLTKCTATPSLLFHGWTTESAAVLLVLTFDQRTGYCHILYTNHLPRAA
jgi:hypothetical protein